MSVYRYTISYTSAEYGEPRKQLTAEYITVADHIDEARERCWSRFKIAHDYERPQVYSLSGQLITGDFIES